MKTELTVADIAESEGCSRVTAWRWLIEIEKKHGSSVVKRRGRRLFATREALERVAIWKSRVAESKRLPGRVKQLEERMRCAEVRASGLARELFEFRRLSNEWFKKHEQGGLIRK